VLNTLIQFKRSLTNNSPTALNIGEPGYSYSSNTLFIGTSGNNGVIEIGGSKYIVQLGYAFDAANSAFIQANSAYQSQNATGNVANSAYTQANAAFIAANAITTLIFGGSF
jgi:hypothetical protein